MKAAYLILAATILTVLTYFVNGCASPDPKRGPPKNPAAVSGCQGKAYPHCEQYYRPGEH